MYELKFLMFIQNLWIAVVVWNVVVLFRIVICHLIGVYLWCFNLHSQYIVEANSGAEEQNMIINATGCGFESYSRKFNSSL